MSEIEHALDFQMLAMGWEYEREYRFAAMHVGGMGKGVRANLKKHNLKDWRFDFAWPDKKVAVECEGGAWTGGRHTRGKGFSEDLIKYDAAMRMGWVIYRCDGAMVKSGRALETIRGLLEII